MGIGRAPVSGGGSLACRKRKEKGDRLYSSMCIPGMRYFRKIHVWFPVSIFFKKCVSLFFGSKRGSVRALPTYLSGQGWAYFIFWLKRSLSPPLSSPLSAQSWPVRDIKGGILVEGDGGGGAFLPLKGPVEMGDNIGHFLFFSIFSDFFFGKSGVAVVVRRDKSGWGGPI